VVIAADEPKPVFATSGLQFCPFSSSALKVIDVKGGRAANDSGVKGSPRASIFEKG
jgi:hypothetical protein